MLERGIRGDLTLTVASTLVRAQTIAELEVTSPAVTPLVNLPVASADAGSSIAAVAATAAIPPR